MSTGMTKDWNSLTAEIDVGDSLEIFSAERIYYIDRIINALGRDIFRISYTGDHPTLGENKTVTVNAGTNFDACHGMTVQALFPDLFGVSGVTYGRMPGGYGKPSPSKTLAAWVAKKMETPFAPNVCDCGAEKAKTTHAKWCSTHGRSEV